MGAAYTGGCVCGALRYAMAAEPFVQSQCQCRDCQRRSGTGHAAWMVFAEPPADATLGPRTEWDVTGENGTAKRHVFCPTCGSPVFMAFPARPDLIAIHAASLDDPSRFAPSLVTWTSAAQGWDRIDPGLAVFPKMPPAA